MGKKKKGTKKAIPLEAISGGVEDLTPAEAQHIVVDNTPFPHNFSGPDQLLKELGILGDKQVAGHKAGIVTDIQARNMTIDENDITSGPGVSVAACRDSVFNNAN